MHQKNRLRRRSVFATIVALALTLSVLSAGEFTVEPANAANAADFRAGNIISDDVFFNKNTMSESQIQSFLESKVRACAAGATCLKDFRQDTYSRAGDAMCSAYSGGSRESAARIIYKVAQACGVNPQVIIVMLQKEQGLVASSSPSSWAWQASMGYACPDTAPCDTQYYGFYNQVYKGVWQLKRYGNPTGTSKYFTWFPVGGVANIQFHPNAACGTAPVAIANKATAALYYYTPYQPNAAALAAGYGASSDKCSSYGNRNFFNYFSDWFGATVSPGPAAIDAVHAAAGGSAGVLGAPVSDYNPVENETSTGFVRAYANGAIAWSAQHGAFAISGPIRTLFNAEGGISGGLGWPVSTQNSYASNGGGTIQAFEKAAITLSPSGTYVLSGQIRAAYNATGSLNSPLGWPSGAVSCAATGACTQTFQNAILTAQKDGAFSIDSPQINTRYAAAGGTGGSLGKPTGGVNPLQVNGGGFVQAYANGAIAFSPAAGAFVLSGTVRTQFNALGGLGGPLGWPTAEASCDATKACSQTFQGGTVRTTPSGEAAVMSAPINALYTSMGGSAGILGAPQGNTSAIAANGGGEVQGFANGAITWTKSSGAIALTGAIRAKFGEVGGLTGEFGWPVSTQNTLSSHGGGKVQGFQNGAITWTEAGGAHTLSGQIRAAFTANGGLDGPLGWPTQDAISVNGGKTQQFQNGVIAYSTTSGAHVITGDIRIAHSNAGGVTGALGWPTMDLAAVQVGSSSGTVQRFESGVITQKAGAGAFVLSGPIRAFFDASGGLSGRLGWPVGAATCPTSDSCSQAFEGGTVDWTKANGAKYR